MKFIRKEVSRNLLTHWKYNLLLYLVLCACVLMAFVVIYNADILASQSKEFESNVSGKRYFQLSPLESSYDMLNSNEKMFSQIGVVEEAIQESTHWDAFFFFVSNFGLDYNNDGGKCLPEIFEEGYESGQLNDANPNTQILKVLILSPGAFPAFGLNVSEGRLFNDEDLFLYEEKGETSAVILGAAYREYYKIGDTIHGGMYTPDANLIVIGFLEEGSLFISPDNTGLISLDRYIILPTHTARIMSDGSIEKDPRGFYGAQMSSGILAVADPSINVQEEMNRITNIYGFPGIKCTPWGSVYLGSMHNISERNVFLFASLSAVLCILSVVFIARVLMKKTEKNMPNYAAYMMSGICPRSILIAAAVEASILALLAVLPPIWISYFQFHTMTVPIYYLLLVSMLITAISLIPALKLIAGVNLDLISRRKSE